MSHVGNVRAHNEDSHFIDADEGLFVVCDGMGGHAAGEVASALAVNVIRDKWASNEVHNAAARWLQKGSPEAHKQLIDTIRGGVVAAHGAILEEAARDEAKTGMGTTLVGAVVVGGDCVFAHAGDSRAYLVRDGIAMQLTEDHTLLARLMAAGVEVDTTGEGSRFKSMLTNALGIGPECKVSTFVVPLADGDRFLLCSDGISEYVTEAEVGEILCKQPSPARAAQKLVDFALERGGADNATALVVRVLEAGERPQSALERKRDDAAIAQCALYVKLSPQQRLRAQRIALPRDYPAGEKLPAQTLGDRVAWIIVEGEVELAGEKRGPGGLIYPESLDVTRVMPDRDGLWTVTADLRVLALRSDDFREICADDDDLAEALLEGLNAVLGPAPDGATPPSRPSTGDDAVAPPPGEHVVVGDAAVDPRAATDPDIQLPGPVPRPTRASSESDTAALVTDSPAMHAEPKNLTTIPPPLRRMATLQSLPAFQLPRSGEFEALPVQSLELATDGETDLDRVPTVVGPPPKGAIVEGGDAHDRAGTEPVEELTPRSALPLTLELEPLAEVPTAVRKRPTPPAALPIVAPPVTTRPLVAPRAPTPPPGAPTPLPRLPRAPTPLPLPAPLLTPVGALLAPAPAVVAVARAIPARVVDAPSASVNIDFVDEPTSPPEVTEPGAPAPEPEPVPAAAVSQTFAAALAAAAPVTSELEAIEELDADLEDEIAEPPAPPRPPAHARVISSEDSAMASGSIGGDAPATPAVPAPRPGAKPRSKRISEGWE